MNEIKLFVSTTWYSKFSTVYCPFFTTPLYHKSFLFQKRPMAIKIFKKIARFLYFSKIFILKNSQIHNTKCLGKKRKNIIQWCRFWNQKNSQCSCDSYTYIFDSANSLVVDPYEEVCLEDMSWIKM